MMKKRLIWADSLKGWLIILVVLGHAIQNTLGDDCESNHLWNLIYSFHMPAFMAVSGFLAFRTNVSYVDSGGHTIKRRFYQLIIPFLVWSFLLMIFNSGLSWNVVKSYILYPDKGLWFLWVLFHINVFFVAGCWLAERSKLKQEVVIFLICLILVGIMVVFNPRRFGFQFIAYYFLFYSLGYYLQKYKERIITRNLFVIAVIALCWLALAWFWKMHELPSWLEFMLLPETLLQYVYRFITAAVAIYLLVAVSPMTLISDNKVNQTLVKLGVVSLGIYTTHFIMIGRVVKMFGSFISNDTLIIICSFLFALMVSWIIVWLLSKSKITAKVMLGKN